MAFPKEISIKLSRTTIGEGQILYNAVVSDKDLEAAGSSPEKITAVVKAIKHFETKFNQNLLEA